MDKKYKLKKYYKQFKKDKQGLIKLAKQFQTFDYDFMEKIIFHMIRMFYDFYKDKDLLYQDTEWEFGHWKECTNALKRLVEIADKLDGDEFAGWEQESKLRYEFYSTIGKYIEGWWD